MAVTTAAVQYNDLREWIRLVDELGEVRGVRGAHWDVELGTITDLYQRRMGLPSLLFDEITDYPAGYRVLSNTLTSNRRIAVTMGLPPETNGWGIIKAWRAHARAYPTLPRNVVKTGPVNENVQRGADVDLFKFPSPRWHQLDGGRYIGTGCLVIQKDLDSDWVNIGVYRVMVHDRNHLGLYISPGKHGRIILEKYWKDGKPCPVAISVGHDPMLFLVGGLEIPFGVSEYDVAGGLRGRPSDVVVSDVSGLPIPAAAEIVLEGELHPGSPRRNSAHGCRHGRGSPQCRAHRGRIRLHVQWYERRGGPSTLSPRSHRRGRTRRTDDLRGARACVVGRVSVRQQRNRCRRLENSAGYARRLAGRPYLRELPHGDERWGRDSGPDRVSLA